MIAYKFDKTTGKGERKKYPRNDTKKCVGLDKNIEWYYLKEDTKPQYNFNSQYLHPYYDRTEEKEGELKICYVRYSVEDYSKEIVIERLNNSFGTWIDDIYPPYKRTNDAIIEPSSEGDLRIARYKELRNDREQRELNYINNNIVPSFEWVW